MANKEERIVAVAALQFACTDDVDTNVAKAEKMVREAHSKGANIVLIQVCVCAPYSSLDPFEPDASLTCIIGSVDFLV
jgi:predicted amidohydrolase